MPNVADLEVGKVDTLGQKITCVYGKKPPIYGVYGANRRVMINYADATETGLSDQQRKILSTLAPLRGEIDGLIDGWREGMSRSPLGVRQSAALRSKADRYDRRVADALVVALEGDVPDATAILARIRQDILDDRIARARFEYLLAAVAMAAALMFGAWLVTATFPLANGGDEGRRVAVGVILLLIALLGALGFAATRRDLDGDGGARPAAEQAALRAAGTEPEPPTGTGRIVAQGALLFGLLAVPVVATLLAPPFVSDGDAAYPGAYQDVVRLWRAAAAGSVGAFFSIAIGIRGRTVLPDLLRTANLLDAALRVSIGFIAAGVLEALLRMNAVGLDLGRSHLGSRGLLEVLVAGFVAGFSERLVPDLLARAGAQTPPPAMRPVARTVPLPPDAADETGPHTAAGPKPSPPADTDAAPDQAGEDGCLSDHAISEADITPDNRLPAAKGGVAAPAMERAA